MNGISIDGVLGIRTRDHRMEGVYESTVLWRPTAHQKQELLGIDETRKRFLTRSRPRPFLSALDIQFHSPFIIEIYGSGLLLFLSSSSL